MWISFNDKDAKKKKKVIGEMSATLTVTLLYAYRPQFHIFVFYLKITVSVRYHWAFFCSWHVHLFWMKWKGKSVPWNIRKSVVFFSLVRSTLIWCIYGCVSLETYAISLVGRGVVLPKMLNVNKWHAILVEFIQLIQ